VPGSLKPKKRTLAEIRAAKAGKKPADTKKKEASKGLNNINFNDFI
jgi:hypothetical protein